jgi:hypothetical protein
VQVIGAGFGRTGTLSFKRALEVDWDDLFERFGSGVDYPVSCVWEDLATHYPDAKVVLTVRDPQRWWESTISTIYGFRTAFAPWLQRAVPLTGQFVEMVDLLVWDGLFDGKVTDRAHAVEVFEQHIEHVRKTCPPERLLVFDVADGWQPLCEFLDVPVPRRPFPHLNDAKVTRRVVAAVRWGTRAAPLVATSAVAGLVLRRRRR